MEFDNLLCINYEFFLYMYVSFNSRKEEGFKYTYELCFTNNTCFRKINFYNYLIVIHRNSKMKNEKAFKN